MCQPGFKQIFSLFKRIRSKKIQVKRIEIGNKNYKVSKKLFDTQKKIFFKKIDSKIIKYYCIKHLCVPATMEFSFSEQL
ncbi:hypothetical protein LEP1GSC186_1793 [Leptospira noguchii serovar Autumnalis str. ZUN142]|uniref:Uncharacterized protein n=1 Tax=Leptospira noguchii serovar Autumnalis str. ZUN142 TaxID=1085540 RepID=M6UL87_9LEPT|nr:hypothetical protein LEP1GSC186_1793 [Leptospira noguchii serovar Autumnalis str. ZUN142]